MSQLLAKYPSSNGRSIYEIIEGKDGVVYCTCLGWRNRKTCKHLLDWTLRGGLSAKEVFQAQSIEEMRGVQSINEETTIEEAIKIASKLIKG